MKAFRVKKKKYSYNSIIRPGRSSAQTFDFLDRTGRLIEIYSKKLNQDV